jgi:hypothetical protein
MKVMIASTTATAIVMTTPGRSTRR